MICFEKYDNNMINAIVLYNKICRTSTLGSCQKIQPKQNSNILKKILRPIANAPPSIFNLMLHSVLKVKTISKETKMYYIFDRFPSHPSPLIYDLATCSFPGNNHEI